MGCGIVEKTARRLEVTRQVSEAGQFEELLAGWRLINGLVLEYPGKVVRDEDGVEACCQGGINV